MPWELVTINKRYLQHNKNDISCKKCGYKAKEKDKMWHQEYESGVVFRCRDCYNKMWL